MSTQPLTPLFSARSIAFIGASKDPGKWGFLMLKHLLDGGFPGRVYPINPKEKEILNLKVYRSLTELPETPDLAVIIVPPPVVPVVIRECLDKGTRSAIIITAGFAETGGSGALLQGEIVEQAQKGGMVFVGPNCNGIMSPWNKQYIQFPGFFVPPGPIGVIAQSGNVVDALALQIRMRGFGCSACIASGNEALLHCEDYLQYLGADPQTKVILAYLEGFKDGKRFLKTAREVSRKKPLIVLKAGKTQAGARAAASHTAAIAGEEAVFEAVCRQSGIIRVHTLEELVDAGLAFLRQPLPCGRRVGIITAGGGWGVLAADACAELGFEVIGLPEDLIRALDKILPPWWSRGNPVDLVAGTSAENIFQAVEWVLQCPSVDALMFLSLMPALRLGSFDLPSDPNEHPEWNQRMIQAVVEVMERFHDLAEKYHKPVLAASEYMWAGHVEQAEINHALGQHGFVCYRLPSQAARTLKALYDYSEFLRKSGKGTALA